MKKILAALFFGLIFADFSAATSFVEGIVVGIPSVIAEEAGKGAENENKEITLEETIKQLVRDPAVFSRVIEADEEKRQGAPYALATKKVTAVTSKMRLMEYVIPEGLNLTLIAKRLNTTQEIIMELNRDNPAIKSRDLILAGYKIYVPAYPEAEVQKAEVELIEHVADMYYYADKEIRAADDEMKTALQESALAKKKLVETKKQLEFVKDELNYFSVVVMGLTFLTFVLLVLLLSRKEKKKEKVCAPQSPLTQEKLMDVLENAPIRAILNILNTPAVGGGRIPKNLKKLPEYIEELRKTTSNEEVELILNRSLKDLPGYNRPALLV